VSASLYKLGDSKRFLPEDSNAEPWRDEARRDYARVIHCPAFRRLQGKTQIFPGYESDFFRNRLTHSLEVAQIAESIAIKLNATTRFFKRQPINPRICFTAALLHDIGHPPFGHNGEEALDECMRPYGGFEGNAQTLRIVTQLEKKRYRSDTSCPLERRAGLNLTYRTLGAILKYDTEIEADRTNDVKVRKGYYSEDKVVVDDIKKNVSPGNVFTKAKKFKTIECQIMDIADDIAYSTYDIEDTFKAGFLKPSDMLLYDETILKNVARKVREETGIASFDATSIISIFLELFEPYISPIQDLSPGQEDSKVEKILSSLTLRQDLDNIANDGNMRTNFTSYLIGEFIKGVGVSVNSRHPELSKIKIDKTTLSKIETLKNFTYEATIRSHKVAVSEFRGKDIVSQIFSALDSGKGYLLLPDDFRILFDATMPETPQRKRVICDFIAGMTDRYAIEFWGRLYSDRGTTMFKPL
jgi:dGTPase